jgi:tetratricopeptide (TPR) repeat protein
MSSLRKGRENAARTPANHQRGEGEMRKTIICMTAVCCVVLLAALFLSCGNEDKGRVPVTTKSKEALKLYREAMVQMDQVQTEKAKALFEQAIQKDSSFAMAYYRLASISFEPQKFLKNLSMASYLADRVTEGEQLQIQSLQEFANGNNTKGADLTRKLIELYPKDREAHLEYAGYLNGLQKYDEAAEEYRKVVTIDPAYAMGYNYMAYGYMFAGRTDEAEKAIQKYIELRPAEPNPYDSQGEILRKAGKFEESTSSYRKALSMDSAFTMSQRGIGVNLAIQGKTAEAIAELEIAVKKAPNDGEKQVAYSNMAFTWILAGDYPKAVEAVKKSLAVSEKNKDLLAQSDNYSSIAWILLEQNQFEKYSQNNARAKKLMEASEASEEIKKNYRTQYLFSESDVARRQNQLKKAKEKAEEYRVAISAKNDPFDIRMYQDLIGSLALAEKRYDDAILELEKASQRNCYILYRMAEAYAAKGEKDKANELYSKVVNFNEYNWGFAFLRAKAQKKSRIL